MPSLPREQRFPGTSLCFDRDCPHCGYAMVYPPVEFASGEVACIWCADSEQRPACWRVIDRERQVPLTSDAWMLERIRAADGYPVLNLQVIVNVEVNIG